MSKIVKDGAMVVLAAGGVLALATTAEFGLPAIVVGAGMSILSGLLAVNGKTRGRESAASSTTTSSARRHRSVA